MRGLSACSTKLVRFIYFQRDVLVEDTFHLVVKRVNAIGKALGRLRQRSRLRTCREAGRAEGVLQVPCPVRKPTQRILHVAPICQLAAHVLLEVWVAHLIYGDVEVLVLQKLPELLRKTGRFFRGRIPLMRS